MKVLSANNIKEKLDGSEATATVVEVTIEPGKAGLPHRHPGSAIGSTTGWITKPLAGPSARAAPQPSATTAATTIALIVTSRGVTISYIRRVHDGRTA